MRSIKALPVVLAFLLCAQQVFGAVAFRTGSAVTGNVTTTASPVVTAPTGLADGDLVIILFGLNDVMTQHGTPTLNGFTACAVQADNGPNGSIHALYKIASGEGASWTFTNLWTAATSGKYGAVAYTGVDSSDPLDSLGCNPGVSSGTTTPLTNQITPAGDGRMIVGLFGTDPGGAPTGTAGCTAACVGGTGVVATERADAATSGTGVIYMEDYLQATATAVNLDYTSTENTNYSEYIMALKPAAAATSRRVGKRGVF